MYVSTRDQANSLTFDQTQDSGNMAVSNISLEAPRLYLPNFM